MDQDQIENDINIALMVAALSGNKEIVEFLLANGAHVAAVNDEKKTALDIAKENNHLEIVELLYRQLKEIKDSSI